MPVTQDAVLEKLKNVIDPELFVNIVDLGLIYEIKLSEAGEGSPATAADKPAGADLATSDQAVEAAPPIAAPGDPDPNAGGATHVFIDMTMTSPACPAGPQLIGGAQREVSSIEGVDKVEVKIVLDPPWTPDRMTEDAKDQLGIFWKKARISVWEKLS